MAKIVKREFVPLAKNYQAGASSIGGWFVSEKLDGQRAFWDGGVSRGCLVKDIPYANHGMPTKLMHKATGLWSRYGNVVFAPDSWLDQLPDFMLDGELYIARDSVQLTRSIVSRHVENRDDNDWRQVKFFVFGLPSISGFCEFGHINTPFHKAVITADVANWILDRKIIKPITPKPFSGQVTFLEMFARDSSVIHVVKQVQLPNNQLEAATTANRMLNEIVAKKGEGLIASDPNRFWSPHRKNNLLKIKDKVDASATIIGFKSGTGKYAGMLGSLYLEYDNIRFYLSGMDDYDRELKDKASIEWAHQFPGEHAPSFFRCNRFRVGQLINFEYNGLTKDGVPKEARYIDKVYPE